MVKKIDEDYYGVFASSAIAKDTYLGQYMGEQLESKSTCLKRQNELKRLGITPTSFIQVDSSTRLDSSFIGNRLSFLNKGTKVAHRD
jgi:hypothetical protein